MIWRCSSILSTLLIFQIVNSQRVTNHLPKDIIIHFDLKGAPPRPTYFLDLLTTISKLGATGIIIEWEDMFPYSGRLERMRNGNAYSMEETLMILDHAHSLGLTIVPLVQTLGHLEWILKTKEAAHLREDPRYPMVACIGDEEAVDLILEMVNQVLDVHAKYPLPFYHIGADEVYQIGICEADKMKLSSKFQNDTKRLVYNHIQHVSLNISQQQPNTKVLIWFDELRNGSPELIEEYQLDKLVIPVVWKYTDNLDKDLPIEMWTKLSKSFRQVWGGSAFKGADGANKIWNRMKPYVQNNKQWFLQSVKYSAIFSDFHGFIMTGWQRYDHFASLCETFPVSMSSLALNIKILQNFVIIEKDISEIAINLKCPKNTNISSILSGTDKCRFPGYNVRDLIRSFEKIKLYYENSTWIHNRENGWLQSSQMLLAASNPYNVDVVGKIYSSSISKIEKLISDLRISLIELYYDDMVEEMLIDYIYPFYDLLRTRLASVSRIDNRNYYPPRPWLSVEKE
ncbi:unnamed protein product [Auanema sp. JU1783]|nr:unnamed protein product [Auanema sp. JU1783]